jgi:hypothetical protein
MKEAGLRAFRWARLKLIVFLNRCLESINRQLRKGKK